jgi:hypothetical protein
MPSIPSGRVLLQGPSQAPRLGYLISALAEKLSGRGSCYCSRVSYCSKSSSVERVETTLCTITIRPKCNILDTYNISPITAEQCRTKMMSLLRTSILFHPHKFWWRCRVPPPGPLRLFHIMFIVIVKPKSDSTRVHYFSWLLKRFDPMMKKRIEES